MSRSTPPPSQVWAALADIGNIHIWNPGVQASHLTGEQEGGVGASRFCDLGGGNYLNEAVMHWVPEEALTMRVTGTNMPLAAVDIRFTLQANDAGTRVTVSPVYTVKYGILGQLLDAIFVKRTYRQGMQALLRGLRDYVERW